MDTAVFDLTSYVYQDTAEFNLPSPRDGKPTGWVWTLAGPAHPKTISAIEAKWRRDQAERDRQTKARIAAAEKGQPDPTFEISVAKIIEQQAQEIAPRVLGFTTFKMQGDAESTEYNPDAVLRILIDMRLAWVRNQIARRLESDANFLLDLGEG